MALEMESMAAAIGVSVPVLRFLLCFVATIPVSFAWRLMPGPAAKHLYAAASGAFLSYLSFGATSNLLFIFPMTFGYTSMLLLRRYAGIFTFFAGFAYLISWFGLIGFGSGQFQLIIAETLLRKCKMVEVEGWKSSQIIGNKKKKAIVVEMRKVTKGKPNKVAEVEPCKVVVVSSSSFDDVPFAERLVGRVFSFEGARQVLAVVSVIHEMAIYTPKEVGITIPTRSLWDW
ncbi:hypothetical protein IEQ34_015837 [Dendrobium chrysotoxum]|uniref:Uncharacterized protein n=1 Tax=Dendrobium chrysotoxum TaxID=161865 RepID=A0AAV7G147_DENCH|nr:hypothetical protein IEQ34_015837 [Dendrobium chrysotoxum]